MRSSYRVTLSFTGLTPQEHRFVRTVTVLLCSAHDKDWDLKEEMQGWDVDGERIAKLIAVDE